MIISYTTWQKRNKKNIWEIFVTGNMLVIIQQRYFRGLVLQIESGVKAWYIIKVKHCKQLKLHESPSLFGGKALGLDVLC